MVKVLGCPTWNTQSQTNRYAANSLPATFVALGRMDFTVRWSGVELIFKHRASQLSELFCEALDVFLENRAAVIIPSFNAWFCRELFSVYSAS